MSCKSGNSSVQDGGCEFRGFPSKCHCGLDVVIYTSKTKQNPGRPFFRCPTLNDDHLFKWVEDCVYEEVVDTKSKISIIDNEINNAKSEVQVEISELKWMINELKENGTWSKREIKRIKVWLVCICLTVTVIVILLLFTTKNQNLVIGY
ncbi:uncharacterized protein At1g43920, Chloroplastic-like [Arabidopsis lyrata subsp. lyrata]|uniref:uncharacterized protein At1g43920, Chloroplastic-like n=1 Tax=Arabidopsis lyrata subsp. lyrata TaxID=81972 RepID=UPI000A29D491|nr:uncharacterized protein At1g43920, Chloroplastic-like [Arabidopsis lyrata subsp. lyrata]|eukprot:XP_020879148.1 uncharacterized protein At1g43920, Chloroplastic-like [Arabidopsis lyrata subsp. lyrata]